MSPASARPDQGVELFGDRLARLVAIRRSQLVIGLDPDPAHLWPAAVAEVGGATAAGSKVGGADVELAANAVVRHCELVVDAVAAECVAVKLQVACFERLGAPGWRALSDVAAAARERGLLVIADAKRGDIAVTAEAYGDAFLGQTPTPFGAVDGLGADAMTANPLLGADSMTPLIGAARQRGAGVFVLVRTSNPGARDLQDRSLESGETVSDVLAQMVRELGEAGIGDAGLADVGAVVGATVPARLEQLRSRMPHTIVLLPGVGAQGGRIEDLAAAFAPHPAAGLIAVSRGIVSAHEKAGGDPAQAARVEARRLRDQAWAVSGG